MPIINYTVLFVEQVPSHNSSSAIKKLKPKTSFGHACTSTKTMKEIFENILEHISHIINQSTSECVVPDLMKVAQSFLFISLLTPAF